MKRNGAVEVLRCLTMFLIVFEHCFAHGAFMEKSDIVMADGMWTLPFAFVWWHVDAFLAISGWFGITFKWSKFLRLYGVILFYSLISLVYQVGVLHEPLNFKAQLIYGGWFGATYTMLMLMAPILNAAVEGLVAKGRRMALAVWGLMALGVVLNWSPYTRWATAVCPLGAGPFTIFHFIFVYLTARLARQLDFQIAPKKLLALGVGVLVGGVALCGGVNALTYVLRHKPLTGMCFGGYSSYDAPHVWFFAIALVMYFDKYVKVSERVGKIATYVGVSTFPIFLIHHATCFGNNIYRVQQFWLYERFGAHPLAFCLVTAVTTFVGCLGVDLVRRAVLGLVKGKVDAVMAGVDEWWKRWCEG